jgi:hypothetical protein
MLSIGNFCFERKVYKGVCTILYTRTTKIIYLDKQLFFLNYLCKIMHDNVFSMKGNLILNTFSQLLSKFTRVSHQHLVSDRFIRIRLRIS